MIGYCPSAGRIQPRHLLSFSTDSTAIAQVNRSLSARATRAYSSRLSLSLSLSTTPFFFFLRSLHGHARRPSRLAPFVLGSMPQLTPGEKKKRKSSGTTGKLCPRRGASDGLTDLLQRPRTPRTPAGVPFLRFSPARSLPATLSERNPRPSS